MDYSSRFSSRVAASTETGRAERDRWGFRGSSLPIAGFTHQNRFWALTGLGFDVQVLFEER
jgi:hypothetical protein